MEDYIPITYIKDFDFCPYSIYLHNVYKNTDETVYQTLAMLKGKHQHEKVDSKSGSSAKNEVFALPVYSDKYGLMGK